MAIETSLKGITTFLERNDELLAEIRDTAKTARTKIAALFKKLKKNRDVTAKLVSKIGSIPFEVAQAADVKEKQRDILQEIKDVSKRIERFRDFPELANSLRAQRSLFYQALGNTFVQSVATIVRFSEQDVDELKVLLRRATLDAQARQNKADLLDAAVQLSKLALKIGVKLAT